MSKEPGVSPTPNRRRRVRHLVAGAAVLALVLTGCGGQRDPSSYSGAKDAFISQCTKQATEDNSASDVVTKIANPKTYCTCVYTVLSKKGGYKFSDFKSVNNDLRSSTSAKKLPADIIDAYSSCDPAKG